MNYIKSCFQGKELEKMFREEGVIDGEEETETEKEGEEKTKQGTDDVGDEVIGHLENIDGQDLGEIVIVSKGKKTKRTISGSKRKKYVCEICSRSFLHYGRYLVHQTYHKGVKYECKQCSEVFLSKDGLNTHQWQTQHTGEGIIETIEDEVKIINTLIFVFPYVLNI